MQLCQLVEHLHTALNHVIKHSQLGDQVWQLWGDADESYEGKNTQVHVKCMLLVKMKDSVRRSQGVCCLMHLNVRQQMVLG